MKKTLLATALLSSLLLWGILWTTVSAGNHEKNQTKAYSKPSVWSTKQMTSSSSMHLKAFLQLKKRIDRMTTDQLTKFADMLTKRLAKMNDTHPLYTLLSQLLEATNDRLQEVWNPSLVDLVVNTKQLSILKDIVVHLDLVDTVNNGEFTVFAPTNEAFEQLLSNLDMTFEELVTNKELLQTVVLYHLIPWTVTAADVTALTHGTLVETVWGESVRVDTANGVSIDDSNVIKTDIVASNGVVHLIDKVLLPASVKASLGLPTERGTEDIVTIASNGSDFTTLVAAVQAAGLVEALQAEGPYTVFAPTNEAFAELLALLGKTAEELLADTDLLTELLLYHVVSGVYDAADITTFLNNQALTTLWGSSVDIQVMGNTVMINDATVTTPNIFATNGVIHVIDTVLLP